jgi:hypothetical protein
MVNAFEGNKAETAAVLPVIEAFMAAHRLSFRHPVLPGREWLTGGGISFAGWPDVC